MWLSLWEYDWKTRSIRRTIQVTTKQKKREKEEKKKRNSNDIRRPTEWKVLNELLCAVTYIKMTFLVSTSIHLLLHVVELKQQNTIKISSKYQFHHSRLIQPTTTEIKLNYKIRKEKNWSTNSPNLKRICCEKVSDVVERRHSSALKLLHHQRAPIDSDKYIASDEPMPK